MDDSQLKQLFESQEIPAPNDNRRKEALKSRHGCLRKKSKNRPRNLSLGSSDEQTTHTKERTRCPLVRKK